MMMMMMFLMMMMMLLILMMMMMTMTMMMTLIFGDLWPLVSEDTAPSYSVILAKSATSPNHLTYSPETHQSWSESHPFLVAD